MFQFFLGTLGVLDCFWNFFAFGTFLNSELSQKEDGQPEELLRDLHCNICSRFPPTTSNKVLDANGLWLLLFQLSESADQMTLQVPRAKYWIPNQNSTSIKNNPGDCGLSKALNHPRRVKRGLPGTSDTQVLCSMKKQVTGIYAYRWSWFLQALDGLFRTFFWDPLDLFRAYISIRPSHIHTALNIILTCSTSLPVLKVKGELQSTNPPIFILIEP